MKKGFPGAFHENHCLRFLVQWKTKISKRAGRVNMWESFKDPLEIINQLDESIAYSPWNFFL